MTPGAEIITAAIVSFVVSIIMLVVTYGIFGGRDK